jgi:hypothetical protein
MTNDIENITMAVLMLSAHNGKIGGTRRELAKEMMEMKRKGIDIGHPHIGRDALGYYSDTLSSFVFVFKLSGELVSAEPIILNKDGIKTCNDIIQMARINDMKRLEPIAKELGVEI